MSNYPNMSYCMNENTLLALRQVLNAMEDDENKFLKRLSHTERRAYNELYQVCCNFIEQADQLQEQSEFADEEE